MGLHPLVLSCSVTQVTLPADSHVHSEFSWDTAVGDMEGSCARAVEIGLPAIAFTEHLDHTRWRLDLSNPWIVEHQAPLADADGFLTPPAFDAGGYLAAIDRCRDLFPGLRILSGLELGEPHRHAGPVSRVLATGRYDRVLGSVHTLTDRGAFTDVGGVFAHRDPYAVVRDYLAEVAAMMSTSGIFAVLTHIDYPVRAWPVGRPPFDPAVVADDFRDTLEAVAQSGRALELNTRLPLHATILSWWHDVGGEAITFGSDAHLPAKVGHGFADAARMAEAHGFRPGRNPHDLWGRVG